MFVIPECFHRGSSISRQLESGFRLKACRNDNDFCKRLGFKNIRVYSCHSWLTAVIRMKGFREIV
jgi:hypothetical protein